MNILLLVFHPDLAASRVNRIWKEQLDSSGKITTSRDLYAEYPDFKIDVAKEQAALLAHERIVLQFPFYWYSMPPLLKKWLDDVLTHGFAYGGSGDKLKGKELQLLVSVGGRARFYSGFDLYSTIPDLLRPFQLTANLTRMRYLHPEWMYRADSAPEAAIRAYGERWVAMIDDPVRSDPHAWLQSEMSSELDTFYEENAE